MQLVAYGAQDIYLTGNPQITFFKVVYRRHTNFSREAIEQTFNGTAGFGNRVTATISRNGDLLHRMYLRMDVSGGNSGEKNAMQWIKTVDVEIGGQLIDRHYGEWMAIWTQLTHPTDKAAALKQMCYYASGTNSILHVPLQFWFCRNPGLALPLIALQYHEVKVIVEMNASPESGVITLNSMALWCDYIYLDTDERRRFAQVSHEYLIEQVQSQRSNTGATVDLVLNHPVKALYWADVTTAYANDTSVVYNGTAFADAQLKLNGHDRFATRQDGYFTHVQVYEHHSGYNAAGPSVSALQGKVGVYSFALEPEEHQPSGTCNFSRIDTAQLKFGTAPTSLNVYAVNYNVLRIMSGMGGLAYSN